MAGREFDVVLYGATGFVGRITADYLLDAARPDARIALAGRSESKLLALRDSLGPRAEHWATLVADSRDTAAVTDMAERATAVATTVGPYVKYGKQVVAACARAGTHYADLTGEVLFVKECIDDVHELAVASGARIVNSCGFDSVPSDLAMLAAHERAAADGAGGIADATLVVATMRGGISGGTIDSLRTMVDAVRADRSLARVLADPYALSPDREAEPDRTHASWPDERIDGTVKLDRGKGGWLGPFVMASYNTRVVRRSNALQDFAYGRSLRYRELMAFGKAVSPGPVLAAGTAVGLGLMGAGMALPPTRAVLDRVLPAPGEGPKESTWRNGHFTTKTHVRTESGRRYVSTFAAQGDPGYGATRVMLAESALALAFDDLPDRAGVLTPATGIGDRLIERLRGAGFRIDVTASAE